LQAGDAEYLVRGSRTRPFGKQQGIIMLNRIRLLLVSALLLALLPQMTRVTRASDGGSTEPAAEEKKVDAHGGGEKESGGHGEPAGGHGGGDEAEVAPKFLLPPPLKGKFDLPLLTRLSRFAARIN
jgi:hypothetical protein